MIWILFALLQVVPSYAQVEAILSGTQLEVSVPADCQPGARLVISAQDGEKEILGYADITGPSENSGRCKARVLTHSRSALVRVGDRTDVLNLHEHDGSLTGRYDLVLEDNKKVSARYKPLVYAGYLFGETASTLAQGEFLVGLTPFFYGITNRVQIEATPALALAKIASLGAKYKFYDGEDITFAIQGTANQHFEVGKRSWSATLYYDSTSNSRSMSHTTLMFTSKLPTDSPLEAKDKQKRFTAELTSTYEFVFKNWQRLLFGPKFTAGDSKDLGFVATGVFPYEYFHFAVNMELNSITRLEFRNKKQIGSFDLFWRF